MKNIKANLICLVVVASLLLFSPVFVFSFLHSPKIKQDIKKDRQLFTEIERRI